MPRLVGAFAFLPPAKMKRFIPSGQSTHWPQYTDCPFQIVGLYRQSHFGSCSCQLAQQEPSITQYPLLQIPKGMLNRRTPDHHHFWMGLHSLFHSLKRRLMGVTRNIAACSLGTPRFKRASFAIADRRLVNPLALVELLECQKLACRATERICLSVVFEIVAFEDILRRLVRVPRPIRGNISRNTHLFTGLKLLAT